MKVKQFCYCPEDGWIGVAKAQVLDSEKSVVLIFVSPELVKDKSLFQKVRQDFPNSRIIGCSSAGEISNDRIRDKSLTCAIMQLENGEIKVNSVDLSSSEDSLEAGKGLAKKFELEELKGIFVLSDGLNANGTDLTRGINSIIDNNDVVVAGGLAGDGARFEQTYLIEGEEIVQNKVIAIGLYGNLDITHGTEGGWSIFGPKRKITRSEGNVLYEIDGQPALTLYKEYLGERSKDLPASALFFPLEISAEDSNKRLVRTILGINENDQSMTFAGDVPIGAGAQFMRCNSEKLVEGAAQACGEAMDSGSGNSIGDDLILAISCVGRKLVLGNMAEEEVEAVYEMGKQSNVIGFHSYGELSPLEKGAPCELHNQSMTIMKITEKKAS